MSDRVDVSVVIPTFDRCAGLARVLDGLAAQRLPHGEMEVIVVSDGSTDGTDDLLAEWADGDRRQALRQDNRGPAAARNRGAAVARGELLVFLDDDVVPAPALVAHHLTAHRSLPPPVATFGPMVAPPHDASPAWVRWEHAMLVEQYSALTAGEWAPTARQFYTGNSAVPRQVFERVGGFDPGRRRAEDTELAFRLADAGIRFEFLPEALGYHHVERSLDAWLAIPGDYGRSDVGVALHGAQEWMLPTIGREFGRRHGATRALTRVTVGRPWLVAAVSRILVAGGVAVDRLGAERLGRGMLSTVHNLRYYHGVTSALGGRRAFLDLVNGEGDAVVERERPAA